MGIKFSTTGSFDHIERYLKVVTKRDYRSLLEKFAERGVLALELATPKDSGITANSWRYEIVIERRNFTIQWSNISENNGVPIVILIQYGHATRSGSFVEGKDFINPTMRPIFEEIVDELWKEVTAL